MSGRRSQATGSIGQSVGETVLSQLGYEMVESINTAWSVRRSRGGEVKSAYPTKKVSGDIIAIEPGTGKKVLVEIKTTDVNRPRLPHSALQEHQVECLTMNEQYGGISLLMWITDRVYVMKWIDLIREGFVSGTSISREAAEKLNIYKEAQ